jgi:hypothetical protein
MHLALQKRLSKGSRKYAVTEECDPAGYSEEVRSCAVAADVQ